MGIFIAKSDQDAENYGKQNAAGEDVYNEANKHPKCQQILAKIKMTEKVTKSHGQLDTDHYMMWKNDMRGKIWNHVLVIGKIEHYGNYIDYMSNHTNQFICF